MYANEIGMKIHKEKEDIRRYISEGKKRIHKERISMTAYTRRALRKKMLREGEQEEHYLQFNLTHDVSPIRSHNAEIMDHLMFTDGSQQVKEFLML